MVAIAINADKAASFTYTDGDGLQFGVNEIPHIEQFISDNFKIGKDDCCGNSRHIKFLDIQSHPVKDVSESGLGHSRRHFHAIASELLKIKRANPDKLCGYGRWKPRFTRILTGKLKESTPTAESP